jgi:hypothetical protein
VHNHKTLSEARVEFFDMLRAGTKCPCCDRFGKIYRRKLNSSMALTLIRMFNHEKKQSGWIHMISVGNFDLPSRDYGTLMHWKLTEEKPGKKPDGNPEKGYYRLTANGRAFVLKQIRVPKYVYLFDNILLDVDEPEKDETVNISEALGNRFNYTELMEE